MLLRLKRIWYFRMSCLTRVSRSNVDVRHLSTITNTATVKRTLPRSTKRRTATGASSDKIEDDGSFPRHLYLEKFLVEAKVSPYSPKKLFPGIGAVTVEGLLNIAGGDKQLLAALETHNIDALSQDSKILSRQAATQMCETWSGLSNLPLAMLNTAGLSTLDIRLSFANASNFEAALQQDPLNALQRLNRGWSSFTKLRKFAQARRLTLTESDKLLLASKAVLEDSRQVCLPSTDLYLKLLTVLNGSKKDVEDYFSSVLDQLDEAKILKTIQVCSNAGLVVHNNHIYLYKTRFYEKEVGNLVRHRINLSKIAKVPAFDDTILSDALSEEQRESVKLGLRSKFFLLTGGPGTGKTFCVGEMIRAWKAKDAKIIVSAFTARSAQVLMERAGASQAQTIHRLLEAVPVGESKTYFRKLNLECDVFILDEATLVDLRLMHEVLSRVDENATIVMIGDPDQLGSIGSGRVFQDLLDERLTSLITRAHLTEPRRQQTRMESDVFLTSQALNAGTIPGPDVLKRISSAWKLSTLPNDVQASWIATWPGKASVMVAVEAILKMHSVDSVQVLVPQKAEVTNADLKQLFRNATPGYQDRGLGDFRIGDRVMHTVNDYKREVLNGEVGTVVGVDVVQALKASAPVLKVEYGGGKIIQYSEAQLKDLTFAYCLNVHKSQGSEYDVVVFVLDSFALNCTREMLFTACTRAKKRLFIFATSDSLNKSLAKTDVRFSNLVDIILGQESSETGVDSVPEKETLDLGISIDAPQSEVGKLTAPAIDVENDEEITDLPPDDLPEDLPSSRAASSKSTPFVSMKMGTRSVVGKSSALMNTSGSKPSRATKPGAPATLPSPKSSKLPTGMQVTGRDIAFHIFEEAKIVDYLESLLVPSPPSTVSMSPPVYAVPKSPTVVAPLHGYMPLATKPKTTIGVGTERGADASTSKMISEDDIVEISSDSVAGVKYAVNKSRRSCTCPGFLTRGRCKHVDRLGT